MNKKFEIGKLHKLEDSVYDDVYNWCMSWIEDSFDVEDSEDLTSDQLWEIEDYANKMYEEEEKAKMNFTALSVMHGIVMSTLYSIVSMNEERMEDR